jgi:hypothetical protein
MSDKKMPSCICDETDIGPEDYVNGSEIRCPAKQVLSRKYQSVCQNQLALFYRYFNHYEYKSNYILLTYLTKKYGKAYALTYYTYIMCVAFRCGDNSFIDASKEVKDL